MARRPVDAKNDAKGNISHIKLEGNSSWTPLDAAIRMADRGQIAGVHVVRPSDAKVHIRTNPDGRSANNLDTLADD